MSLLIGIRCLKIKVLDNMPNTSNGVDTPNSELEAYPLANLLQKVEKHYDPSKFLLEESINMDNIHDCAPMMTPHGLDEPLVT